MEALKIDKLDPVVKNMIERARQKEYLRWTKACLKAGMVITDPEQLVGLPEGFRQEGRREVIESLNWESTAYQTIEGSPIIQLQISEAEWQTKLKSWNVEEGG